MNNTLENYITNVLEPLLALSYSLGNGSPHLYDYSPPIEDVYVSSLNSVYLVEVLKSDIQEKITLKYSLTIPTSL